MLAVCQAAASSRARRWLAEQGREWQEGGFAEHMQADRWAAYQLLAGRIDAVTPGLALDWRRALGLQFWCAAAAAAVVLHCIDVPACSTQLICCIKA